MVRFGSFELDEEAGQLRRDGTALGYRHSRFGCWSFLSPDPES